MENQRKFVFLTMIIGVVIVLAVLITMWTGLLTPISKSDGTPMTFPVKIIFTILMLIIILIGYLFYNYQKKLDVKKEINMEDSRTLGEKAFSVSNKIGGWSLRLKAIWSFILGSIFIILGIVLPLTFKTSNSWVLLGIGLIILLVGWFYWYRAKSLVKGRYY